MLCIEVNENNLDDNYAENSKWREVVLCIACFDPMRVTLKIYSGENELIYINI